MLSQRVTPGGARYDQVCTAGFQCDGGASAVDDDSGCAGLVADDCGDLKDSVCGDATVQNGAPSCEPCMDDDDCDPGKTCTDGPATDWVRIRCP